MNPIANIKPWLSVVTLLLAGCITINIYFPAAAAEKAADQMIDDIWQTPPNTSSSDATGDPP